MATVDNLTKVVSVEIKEHSIVFHTENDMEFVAEKSSKMEALATMPLIIYYVFDTHTMKYRHIELRIDAKLFG
jgi:hypothetical protein